MNIRFNIEKNQRKALAQKIGELAEMDVRYCGVPSCAYEIGFFTLSKDAVLSFADRMDTEVIERSRLRKRMGMDDRKIIRSPHRGGKEPPCGGDIASAAYGCPQKMRPTQGICAAHAGGRKLHKQAENSAAIIVITHT